MKLTLHLLDGDNKEYDKTFYLPRVRMGTMRAIVQKQAELSDAETSFDAVAEIIVDAFGNQFTVDDVFEGVYADEMEEVLTELMNEATSTKNKKKDAPVPLEVVPQSE